MSRSTADMLVLMIAGTVCLSLLGAGAVIAVVAVLYPDRDTTQAAGVVSSGIQTLVGLLAGYLAGRARRASVSRVEE